MNILGFYTVVGCTDVSRPESMWYKREGNEAVIGCENNDQEWRLICTGNTWQGEVGNCSKTGLNNFHILHRDNILGHSTLWWIIINFPLCIHTSIGILSE